MIRSASTSRPKLKQDNWLGGSPDQPSTALPIATDLQLHTPKLFKGVATCAHIISRQISDASVRIPLRILFGVEGLGTFEHIFQADYVIVGGIKVDIAFLKAQGVDSLNGCSFGELAISSREHSRAEWVKHTLLLGDWVTLGLTSVHQRIDRNTNRPFVDNQGRTVHHANYCYILSEVKCTVSMPF